MIKGKFIYQNTKCNKSLKKDRKFEQCFVWKADDYPLYIMDNHRAALWCWMQHHKKVKKNNIGLLHIDNHPDMSPAGLNCICSSKIQFNSLSLEEYLNLKHNPEEKHESKESNELIFSNQNFLRFFVNNNSNIININNFVITLPQHKKSLSTNKLLISHLKTSREEYLKKSKSLYPEHIAEKIDYKELLNLLKKFLNTKSRLILDLDLDFFFKENTNTVNYELAQKIFVLIKKLFDTKKITTLTVAWSPEYLIKFENLKNTNGMYGWKKAQRLNSDFCRIFGIDIEDFQNI